MEREHEFKKKFALLDTNILKEMTQRTKRAELFQPVFDFLKDNDVSLFILDATKFEFLGYSGNKKDFDYLEKWIENFDSLPLSQADIYLAAQLSSMYKCKNPSISPKQISFIDCLYASQLLKFKERIFIVTTDMNDYPAFLFDMPKHIPIEEDTGVTAFVGFKSFSEKKWKKLQEDYEKSA